MSNKKENNNVNWEFICQIAWDKADIVQEIMAMAISFNAHKNGIINNEQFMLSAKPQNPGNGNWDLHLIAPLNALMACAAILQGWEMEINEDEQIIIMS
tara:strand:+ start:20 stop:316 length:297 start_codon:yes stop_codon:yes gene_type:complete